MFLNPLNLVPAGIGWLVITVSLKPNIRSILPLIETLLNTLVVFWKAAAYMQLCVPKKAQVLPSNNPDRRWSPDLLPLRHYFHHNLPLGAGLPTCCPYVTNAPILIHSKNTMLSMTYNQQHCCIFNATNYYKTCTYYI